MKPIEEPNGIEARLNMGIAGRGYLYTYVYVHVPLYLPTALPALIFEYYI